MIPKPIIMKKQILIVDDDIAILKLVSIILADEYSITMKSNGIEAFSWLEDGNFPALIISDLEMPYIHGTSFVKNLKISGFFKTTPVIVLSATDNLAQVINELPVRVDGYLQKPFNPAQLKSTIAQLLEQYESITA